MPITAPCHKTEPNLSQAINKLAFIMWRISARILQEDLKISFAQFKMLMAIWHRGEISQRMIADFHGLTEAAVSRQVEQLVGEKLISRRINDRNRREHLLTLSARGRSCVKRATKELDRHFNKIFDVLGGQKKKFSALLNKLLAHVCAQEPDHFNSHPDNIKS